ncbi:MAG: LysM peptidoglycan-binding domain-containing protein [Anaerolineales bacterium]|nr:LysM peptidoglycan-binding domain-containing protein [Anaerolineales bacterium]
MKPGDKDPKRDMDMLRKAAQLRAVSGRSKMDDVRKKIDEPEKAAVPVEPEKAAKTYKVEAGDTLSGIAEKFLGNANRWPEIFEANKDQIQDPNMIRIGQELVIPE